VLPIRRAGLLLTNRFDAYAIFGDCCGLITADPSTRNGWKRVLNTSGLRINIEEGVLKFA
jgi:hypothetical protein